MADFIAGTLERFPPSQRERVKVEFGSEEPPLGFIRMPTGRWDRELQIPK